METDEALDHERNGANAGLNPMFGDWQHRFNFAPIPYGDGGKKRLNFQHDIQAELTNKFFFSSEVRLNIELYLDIQLVLETSETADLDNYAKSILDGIKGHNGIILDDSQVQALTISWMNSQGARPHFDIAISGLPDDFMLKPITFYEMPNRLWYPHGRRLWVDGGINELSDYNHYMTLLILEVISSAQPKARHLLRNAGMDRLRAYQGAARIASSARGFHKSRIDTGFPSCSLKKWREDFENWRHNHTEYNVSINEFIADIKNIYDDHVDLIVKNIKSGD